MLKPISCSLVAIFALSIATTSPKVGPFGVDTVSAASAPYVAPPTTTKPRTTTSRTTTTTYTTASGVTRLLKLNSMGGDVKLVQTALNTKGYKLAVDGIFGNLTLAAVKDYQGKNGLVVDGLVGPLTLAKLIPPPPAPVVAARLLKLGSVGADVKVLQTTLNTKGYKLTVDGIFGNLTLAAVKNYQSKNGLAADGLVGPLTLAKLNAKVVAPPVVTPPVVTPPVVVVPPVVDVVTAASVVDNIAAFEKSIAADGKWIICTTKDLVSTKDLLLTGQFKNGKKDDAGVDIIQRKIALYTQDKNRVVTARFTLTAPKLTIASPKASLEHGTFKGDLYVTTADFKLIDQTVVGNVYVSGTNFTMSEASKVQGNIYFATEGSKTSFKLLDTSTVTGTKDLQVIDAVATASIVKDDVALEKAMGLAATGGKWIICTLNDITTTKELVLEGEFKNGKKDPITGVDIIQRKIGLYTQAKQDGVNTVTKRFTLTAPKLTINSPEARIQGGIFKGDVYVSTAKFLLTDAKIVGDVYVSATGFNLTKAATVEGNVYFATQELKAAFEASTTSVDTTSSITGTKTVKTN